MCKRTDAVAAQDAAAETLERACSSRFRCEDLRNPVTVNLLPPQPADFAELLGQIHRKPLRLRTQH